MTSSPSLRELIEAVSERFSKADLYFGHGTDNPWDEAVALVLFVTGANDDATELDRIVPDAQVDTVLELSQRRVSERQPLPYLLGRCQYFGLEFILEPGIVVPRSPIGGLLAEGLVPWVGREPERVLDLCCGSGCLGILAAHVFPEATVQMLERNPAAVAVARENIALHGLEDRVSVAESDLFAEAQGTYDVIITIPPYVDAADMASLPAEYLHEPKEGLAAGEDGLTIVHRILADAPAHLASDGLLICEVGASAPALLRVYPALPFVWPHLPEGGEGVFLLEAQALRSHTAGLKSQGPS